MLSRIVYSSQVAPEFSASDLEPLLARARQRNTDSDISGALIFVDGVFLQILEGEHDAVAALMEKIARDPRHTDVTVFHESEIGERAFQSWRMACLTPDAEKVLAWAGLEGSVPFDELLADVRKNPQMLPRIVVSIVETLAA